MDLRQLEYVVEVARRGTFMAAAEQLHVAQPALWKRVRDLERELGVVFFERSGRGVRLTSEGAQLVAASERAVTSAERVRELARDLAGGFTGEVAVTCMPTHIAAFLAGVVGRFRREHPRIRVDLREVGTPAIGLASLSSSSVKSGDSADEGVRSTLLQTLLSGATDVVTAGPLTGAVDGFPIYDVFILAVPPRGHPFHGRKTIPVSRLASHPLAVTPKGYLSRALLDAACAAAGFEPDIAAESASATTLLALGENGLGLPILASDALPAPGRGDHPRLVGPDGPLRTQAWLYRRSGAPTPAVAAFVDVARRAADRNR